MKTVLAMTDHSDDPANSVRLLRPWSDPLFPRSYRNTIGRPTETRNLDSFSSNTRVFHRQGRRIVAGTKSNRETATSNPLLRLQFKAFEPHCYHYHCSVRYTHGKDCTRGIARNSKKRRKNAKRIGSSCTGWRCSVTRWRAPRVYTLYVEYRKCTKMLTRHAGSRSASGVVASLRVFHVPAMKWPAVLCARHNYNVKPSVFSLPPSFLSFLLSILRSGRCTGSKLPWLLPRQSPAQLTSYTHRAFRFINYFYSNDRRV